MRIQSGAQTLSAHTRRIAIRMGRMSTVPISAYRGDPIRLVHA